VATTAGQSADEVAAAIAAAINASLVLSTQGIAAVVTGSSVASNAWIQETPVVTDPGITLSQVVNVPSLFGVGCAILGALLAASGARRASR
jgi:hypothetical protein